MIKIYEENEKKKWKEYQTAKLKIILYLFGLIFFGAAHFSFSIATPSSPMRTAFPFKLRISFVFGSACSAMIRVFDVIDFVTNEIVTSSAVQVPVFSFTTTQSVRTSPRGCVGTAKETTAPRWRLGANDTVEGVNGLSD